MRYNMELKEKLVSTETIYEGKIFDVEQRLITLPDGRETIYDIVKNPNACAVVPMDGDGNVIMVRQFRQSAGKVMLEIPAGKLDEGEDIDACAVRELQEETGYIAGKIEKIVDMRVSPGFSTEIIYIYKAENLTLGETNFDEDEFIETEKIPLDTLYQMIIKGEIEDGKTICGVLAIYCEKNGI
jgi:ADP-ribose pyrophosphatase